MVKIRVKVTGKGIEGDPFRVNLPTYAWIAGSEEYADKAKKVLKSVVVEIPDDEVDEKGKLDPEKIRRKYRDHPVWSKFKG